MTQNNEPVGQFGQLSDDLTRREASLRGRFLATPSLPPASLEAIKQRLRVEMSLAVRRGRRIRATWIGALAAGLLVAVGVGLFWRSGQPSGQPAPREPASFNLDAFTASLPNVLSTGSSELEGLANELTDLENRMHGTLGGPDGQDESTTGRLDQRVGPGPWPSASPTALGVPC